MVESSAGQQMIDENGNTVTFKVTDIIKEGYLFKQSRYIKDWRK